MKLTQLTEQKERPYICVHAKKGKHETHAVSSYDAAKNAAKHWGMKSTAGIDAHLAEGNYPEPRKMEVTQADKDNNTEAWKRFKAGDPRYEWKDMILSKAESYDDYHGDMSKEEYDKTVKGSQMEYTVWVGGTEVNDKWLSYDEAVRLYDKYKAQGYDDVQLDARMKESYSPGDEYTDSEGMVSNCCGAPMMDYNDGHGRCSDCKEMAAGETDEEFYEDCGCGHGSDCDCGPECDCGCNESVNEDEEAIAARDEFLKVMDMKPKSSNKAIDTIKKIVADKQNMQVKFDDGKMKVDLYTASAVSAVYDAVKPETKVKIDDMLRTKEGMLKMSNFAFSKLSEGIKEGKRIDEILPIVGAVAGAVGRAVVGGAAKQATRAVAAKAAGAVGNAVGSAIGNANNTVNASKKSKKNNKKLNAVKGENEEVDESIAKVGAQVAGAAKKVGGAVKTVQTAVGGIKDKTGKKHHPNSPQGKMIKNMTKQNKPTPTTLGKQSLAQRAVGGVKALAKKVGNPISYGAAQSGFGNPLAASKQYANDMVEQAIKKAEAEDK